MASFTLRDVRKVTRHRSIFYKQRPALLPLLFSAVCILLAVALFLLSKADAAFAEGVARNVYRPVSNALGRVTGVVPFSLLEFGLIAVFLILLVLIYIFIHKLVKNKGQRAAIVRKWLTSALCIASAGYLVFMALCGVNYYRRPFSAYSGLEIAPSATDELEALCYRLAEEANALRAALPEDENGVALIFTYGYKPVAQQARTAMQSLSARFDVMEGYYPRPKAITFSTVMSRLDLTGIYCPFTMEANVNVASPEYAIPATMCHELSHLRGFMREDEANFIAYLACMESDDPAFQYSGVTLALIHAGNQLYRADTQRYTALTATYGEGLRRDFTFNTKYWKQFEDGALRTVSTKVNDTYLRANNQHDGVQSYGRMVDLLLALYRQTGSLTLA